MNSANYNELKTKTKIERQLDDAINNINELTSKELFDSKRKNDILDECKALKNALQSLFDLYGENVI